MEVGFPAGQRLTVRGVVDGGLLRTVLAGAIAVLMGLPSGSRIWLAAGFTDLRKGMDGLSALVQTALHGSPYSGHIFVFRGRRGDKMKVLWHSGDGVCLFCKRLSEGKFVWPQAQSGTVSMSAAQLSMLLEGIDWRQTEEKCTGTAGSGSCPSDACGVRSERK